MKEKIIEIKNLSKSFGDIKAVQNLSFSVEKGELFAFLGLNGAGKSTTISIMCGQLSKDAGTVVISGADLDHEIERIHSELGVVFQDSVLDKQLTVKNNLVTRAALYGITGEKLNLRISELTEMFDLGSFMKRPVGKLSGGQRRRVDVARALLHEPTILILDEPTTGLDPKTRRHLWDVLDDIRKKRMMTVFLTTHYMDETTDADHVIILDNGKIAAEGTPIELKNRYTGDFIMLYGADENEAETLIECMHEMNAATGGMKKYEKQTDYEVLTAGVRVKVPDTGTATRLIIKHPEIFKDYEIIKGRMDDVFLNATGKALHQEGGDVQ